MADKRTSSGGAANETGSTFRAAVGAWFIVHALVEKPVEGLALTKEQSIPTGLFLPESDQPVDDIEIYLRQDANFRFYSKKVCPSLLYRGAVRGVVIRTPRIVFLMLNAMWLAYLDR